MSSMIDYRFTPSATIGEGVEKLYQILTYLRSPEGCPWDRKLTQESTAACLIDEVYEYLDGVAHNSTASCREEIGDVMINVFMAQLIHSEKSEFTPVEALNEVCMKLIRRHPHVFGKTALEDEDDVPALWNRMKSMERGNEENAEDIFSKVPVSLPPMEESYEIQKRIVERAKIDLDITDALLKVREELSELEAGIADGDRENQEEEVGDLLFAVVNLSRKLGLRPDIAMKKANVKIRRRFQMLFDTAGKRSIPIDGAHAKELIAIWDEIKRNE